MSEIGSAQLHSELFRRRHSTRQSHGLFALAKRLLVVSTSAIDCLERLVSEMAYYVSSGTLNPTHSLTIAGLYSPHKTLIIERFQSPFAQIIIRRHSDEPTDSLAELDAPACHRFCHKRPPRTLIFLYLRLSTSAARPPRGNLVLDNSRRKPRGWTEGTTNVYWV